MAGELRQKRIEVEVRERVAAELEKEEFEMEIKTRVAAELEDLFSFFSSVTEELTTTGPANS